MSKKANRQTFGTFGHLDIQTRVAVTAAARRGRFVSDPTIPPSLSPQLEYAIYATGDDGDDR